MSTLDYALDVTEQQRPDKSWNFPSPCPEHLQGDEARLGYLKAGFTEKCNKCGKKAVWKASVLCDALFTETYCDKHLPEALRRMLPKWMA